jgi:general secretion pathway protein G
MFNQLHRGRVSRGFTLIELLLVMVILGVLASIVVPSFVRRAEQARITKAKVDIATLKGAIESFQIDNSRYPNNDEGLAALVQAPADCPRWNRTIEAVPRDPWTHDYIYGYPGQHNLEYDVYSMGKDGQESSVIGNWNLDEW